MTIGIPGAGFRAVVPVKAFSRAKTRLSPLLSIEERRELARAMLEDVLAVLSRSPALAGVLVVSGDEEVAKVAAQFGAETLVESIEAGTNAGVQRGLAFLKSTGAGPCLIVHADIPFLSDDELRSIVAALDRSAAVIVPASRDEGTNALALSEPGLIAPSFGCGSFARHVQAATDLGIKPEILHLRGAGHDLDVPADLRFDPDIGAAKRTQAVLGRFSRLTACSFKKALSL